jgi:hypothetical protein
MLRHADYIVQGIYPSLISTDQQDHHYHILATSNLASRHQLYCPWLLLFDSSQGITIKSSIILEAASG